MTRRRVRRPVRVAGLLVVVVAVVVAGCRTSVAPSALDSGARTVDPQALAAPSCEEVDAGDPGDRDHLDPATAPSASELYDADLPAAGPHFRAWSSIIESLPSTPMDPRSLLHNMEHGAVVVWLNPDVVDAGTLAFAGRWRDQLGAAGFDNGETGAAVFVSPFPGHVEAEVAVALRAWGVALDCDAWDLAVADAFVGLHYGTRGAAPEAELGPWPSGNGVLVGPPDRDDGSTTTV